MLTHPTAERLRSLGLAAMADAFTELQNTPEAADLPREDWLGLLVDREATSRDNKRLARRLRDAKLRQAAVVEDTDFRTPRGLDRTLFLKLAGCGWIREHGANQAVSPSPRGDRRPDWGGQELACLCARPQGLLGRLLGALQAGAAAVRRPCHRPGRRTAAADVGRD